MFGRVTPLSDDCGGFGKCMRVPPAKGVWLQHLNRYIGFCCRQFKDYIFYSLLLACLYGPLVLGDHSLGEKGPQKGSNKC